MDDAIVCKLRERYAHLSPLIFQRSVERAQNEGELFDILETIPEAYPLLWDNNTRRWVFGRLFPMSDSIDFDKKKEQAE